MNATLAAVLLVAACVVIGLALYVLDAPGRAARAGRAASRRDDVFAEAEARFQAERTGWTGGDLPPTHERP